MDAHKADQQDVAGIIEAVAAISASAECSASKVAAEMAQAEELPRGCQSNTSTRS